MFLLAAVVGVPGFWLRRESRYAMLQLGSACLLTAAHCSMAAAVYSGNPGTTGTGVYLVMAYIGIVRILAEIAL